MQNDKVRYLTFNEQNAPEVLKTTNRLAELEDRKPHDSIKLLILEAGRAKIAELEASVPAADSGADMHNLSENPEHTKPEQVCQEKLAQINKT